MLTFPASRNVDDTIRREDHLSDGGLAELGNHSPGVGTIGEPLNGRKGLPHKPLAHLGYTLVGTVILFSLLGFLIGLWANSFEQLQIIPMIVIALLTFLGGTFYSISMLPPVWQTVTLFNPVVYLVSGFRWSFYGSSDIHVGVSLGMIALFMLICLGLIGWVFKTGYKLKS